MKLQKYLIKAYSKKIKRHPESLVFMPLANEYKNSGRLEDAMRVVKKGLKNHPHYIGARALSGELLFLSGELEKAELELRPVAEKSPGHILSRRLLLEIYQKFDKYQDALQYAAELAKLCPKASLTFSEIKEELENKITAAGKSTKKERAEHPEPCSSKGAENQSLQRLERFYLSIKSESEVRSKTAGAHNDSVSIDWKALEGDGVSGFGKVNFTQTPLRSKEQQLEILEKMFFNVKKRGYGNK